MNVNLLYADKDWSFVKPYYDWNSIVMDLGLETIFDAATRDVVTNNGKVMYLSHEDLFLSQTMRRVMQIPLVSKEEVLYRQEVFKECLNNEKMVNELYTQTETILADWEKLGKSNTNTGIRNTKAGVITDMQIMRLIVNGISDLKAILAKHIDEFTSAGFTALKARMNEEFSQDIQDNIQNILEDISFYSDISMQKREGNNFKSNSPCIQIDCGIADGLKFGDMKLESIQTKVKSYKNPYGLLSKVQKKLNHLSTTYVALDKSVSLQDDAANLEFQVIAYIMSCLSGAKYSFGHFIEQLHLEIAFYRGAINVLHQMQRYKLSYCYPEVGERDTLSYKDLKEMVMCFVQKGETIGNSGNLDGKMLAIITGANQGGKSTFLRSVGIAQVMMQSGLVVAAQRFRSDLYPSLFTHFTRREDSSMNSGKLDEELRRMDQIVSHLGKDSLVILNESFATTTEKEGSSIAYDIIKALKEENVKILTVTHLLSFAKQIYSEVDNIEESDIAFLSAERLSDGKRTFKMIPHEPELTSFGLELYDKIIKRAESL